MKKVAITGGLSSGKSTVCKILKDKGAYVVSADEIVHKLLSPHNAIGKKIIALLGEDIVENGQFNRALISKKVFGNRQALKSLEEILHPAVLAEVEKQFNQVKNENFTLFVAEIPLLYEIESAHLFDVVIAVIAKPSIAKARFQEKTNHSADEFEKRMTHQLPLSEKMARATYTLMNNGSLNDLNEQVEKLYSKLRHEPA